MKSQNIVLNYLKIEQTKIDKQKLKDKNVFQKRKLKVKIMKSRLDVISNSWHRNYTSESNLANLKSKTLIKLSHQHKFQNKTQNQTQRLPSGSQQFITICTKQMTKKLNNFIHKIQQTFKKILYHKDVKSYLSSAGTSQSEIIDNFFSSLEKFKQLLYRLKEKPFIEDSTSSSNAFSNSHSESHLSQFGLGKKTKKTQTQKVSINIDVLSFLLQYFEQHMIPQTHWSKKKEKQSSIFNSFFNKINFSCFTRSDDENSQRRIESLQQIQLKQTMSRIVQSMNMQDLESARKSGKDLQKQQFATKPIEQTLKAVLKIQELKPIEQMTSIQKIAYLFDLESKVFVSSQFVQSAAFFQDDITTLPKNQFKNVWDFVNYNEMGDEIKINKQYKIMKMLMIITNASVLRQLEFKATENLWFKKVVFGLSFPRYFMEYGKAKLQNQKFLRNPTVQTTKSIWNLPENGFIKELKKPFIFDNIKCNIEFYITRTNSRKLNAFRDRKFDDKIDIFQPSQNSFKVRLLNYKQLDIGNKQRSQVFDKIIIHYHGGGFIALSSCTSQSYTRKWANSLKVPVFSVDYGKPPEFRFPTPVMDCLDAYVFISTQIHKYFNISPRKIFVAGDSAGGNLACALTGMILKLEMQLPQGLLLAYPAVDTQTKFTPSRINSFNDIILYPTLLLLCMKEYLGDMDNQTNPLASPVLLTQDFVSDKGDDSWPSKWPKTILMVGKKDPLYDDTIRLCQKLSSANIEFHCQIYKNLSHAFLSIDKMLPECAQTIQDSIKFFQKLMSGERIGVKRLL